MRIAVMVSADRVYEMAEKLGATHILNTPVKYEEIIDDFIKRENAVLVGPPFYMSTGYSLPPDTVLLSEPSFPVMQQRQFAARAIRPKV